MTERQSRLKAIKNLIKNNVIESQDDFPIYTLVYEIIFNDGQSTLEKIESNTGEFIFEDLYLEN